MNIPLMLQNELTNGKSIYIPLIHLNPLLKVNIPLMRQNELINGIAIYDEQGNRAGTSKLAAKIGISQVITTNV